MQRMISNIVFTKNRPLQMDAYLESLYHYFPSNLMQTYIIYKVELFSEEYELVFKKFPNCKVIREQDFHNDFMNIINQINTKYILFGVDDVVFFDSVDFDVIDQTFEKQCDNIFGFSLRFSPESLKNSTDIIRECNISGEKVFRLNWKKGQTPHTRYPFEFCCTFYTTDFVKKIIYSSMNSSVLTKRLFRPSSALIKFLAKTKLKRKILKRFGFFFSPNTLESWPCRWCRNNSEKLPNYLYFQKLCASALQINMVNATERKKFEGSDGYTIESLAQKYKQGYKLDIGFISANKPNSTHSGQEYFKLK